jgi:hypothetical protein
MAVKSMEFECFEDSRFASGNGATRSSPTAS